MNESLITKIVALGEEKNSSGEMGRSAAIAVNPALLRALEAFKWSWCKLGLLEGATRLSSVERMDAEMAMKAKTTEMTE